MKKRLRRNHTAAFKAKTTKLKNHGIQFSMDGRGRWRDNIFIERLWNSVKYEEVYLKAYDSIWDKGMLSRYLPPSLGLHPSPSLQDLV